MGRSYLQVMHEVGRTDALKRRCFSGGLSLA